jgi:hypothetical protein
VGAAYSEVGGPHYFRAILIHESHREVKVDKDLVTELRAQLEDHDEIVVVDQDDNLIPVADIKWDSRNGRIEVVVEVTDNA